MQHRRTSAATSSEVTVDGNEGDEDNDHDDGENDDDTIIIYSPKQQNRDEKIMPSLGLLPDQFVRLRRRNISQQRQSANGELEGADVFELQTAITTLERVYNVQQQEQRVDVHAQVHFGTREYFDYFNPGNEFHRQQQYDAVHYELLVDETLLLQQHDAVHEGGGSSTASIRFIPRQYQGRLQASTYDQQNARQQYGLSCQVDVIDYTQSGWIHSDLTRQELLESIAAAATTTATTNPNSTSQSPWFPWNKNWLIQPQSLISSSSQKQQPLWALASSSSLPSSSSTSFLPTTWPGVEAAVALLHPLTPSSSTGGNNNNNKYPTQTRRLFSNLFLPGTTLTAWLRALFWFTLPCPELSVLVLDWSSSTTASSSSSSSGALSPIALPVLQCLLAGNLRSARLLLLGAMLMNSSSRLSSTNQQEQQKPSKEPLLIDLRNDHAWKTITSTTIPIFQNDNDHHQSQSPLEETPASSIAILYGSSHIPDLIRRLMHIGGFVPIRTKWRTAWSVTIPYQNNNNLFGMNDKNDGLQLDDHYHQEQHRDMKKNSDKDENKELIQLVATVSLVVLPFYFAIGGWDWISTLQQIAQSLEHDQVADAGIELVLYLIRHALLYVSLVKLLW